MRKTLAGGVGAMALSLVMVSSASAQLLSPSLTGPLCTAAPMSAFDPEYTACLGSFDGNNTGTAANRTLVYNTIEAAGWGLTDVSEIGGVEDFEGTPGTIGFGTTYTNFVLALKQGDYFSLYYFEGSASSVDFSTAGTKLRATTGLSHWTVYGGNETSVPEPGMLLLLGTGLLGLGVTRRREDVA